MPSRRNKPTTATIQRRLHLACSLLFCLALLTGCASIPTPSGGNSGWPKVEGLVSHHSKSFPGATINLRRAENFSTATAPVETATADDKGRFALFVEPGDYLLTAEAPGYFAFFGRNPLRVHADQKNLSLPLASTHVPTTAKVAAGSEGLDGRVLFEGEPVEGAVVQVYLDAKNGFRGQPYAFTLPTAGDGRFSLDIEPGRYHVVAKKRALGQKTGPLEAGDLFGALPELPLPLSTGERLTVNLETVMLPSAEMMARYQTKFSLLSGRIVDESGYPVAGFRPCLYPNARMLDEPLAVGEPTGPDGRFTLRTSRTGAFWVGARETLGGPPSSGERVGFMRPFPPEGLAISPGVSMADLLVIVRPAP